METWNQLREAFVSSPIKPYYDGIQTLLLISPVPRLAQYIDLVLFSFLYFFLLDLFIYYALGDRLCRLNPVDKKSRGLDELNHGGSLRLKWAHMIPSFIHALIVGAGSLHFVLTDSGNLSSSLQTRLMGFDSAIGNMFAFSIGYFLWDIFVCLLNRKVYGPSFLAHALMAAAGLLSAYSVEIPLVFYTNRYLMFELSTIFVDFHWFFAKTGYDKSKRQKVADFLGLASYLAIRMAFGYYTSYSMMKDFWAWHLGGNGNYLIIISATVLQFTTHALNMYWFIKLLKSALKSPKVKKS